MQAGPFDEWRSDSLRYRVPSIRPFPSAGSCRVCSSSVDMPHADLVACRAALTKEMDAILKRARTIANKSGELSDLEIAALSTHVQQLKKKSAQ